MMNLPIKPAESLPDDVRCQTYGHVMRWNRQRRCYECVVCEGTDRKPKA